jgi:hypothetical protein
MSNEFSEGDEPRPVGLAGWLGVCLVVLAVIMLIITAPGKLRPTSGKDSRPAGVLPSPPVAVPDLIKRVVGKGIRWSRLP